MEPDVYDSVAIAKHHRKRQLSRASALTEKNDLKAQHHDVSCKLVVVTKELEDSRASVKRLEAEVENWQTFEDLARSRHDADELDTLKRDYADLCKCREELETALRVMQEERDGAKTALEQAQVGTQLLEKKLSDAQARVDELEVGLMDETAQCTEISEALKRIRHTNKSLSRQAEDKQIEITQMKRDKRCLEEKLQTSTQQRKEMVLRFEHVTKQKEAAVKDGEKQVRVLSEKVAQLVRNGRESGAITAADASTQAECALQSAPAIQDGKEGREMECQTEENAPVRCQSQTQMGTRGTEHDPSEDPLSELTLAWGAIETGVSSSTECVRMADAIANAREALHAQMRLSQLWEVRCETKVTEKRAIKAQLDKSCSELLVASERCKTCHAEANMLTEHLTQAKWRIVALENKLYKADIERQRTETECAPPAEVEHSERAGPKLEPIAVFYEKVRRNSEMKAMREGRSKAVEALREAKNLDAHLQDGSSIPVHTVIAATQYLIDLRQPEAIDLRQREAIDLRQREAIDLRQREAIDLRVREQLSDDEWSDVVVTCAIDGKQNMGRLDQDTDDQEDIPTGSESSESTPHMDVCVGELGFAHLVPATPLTSVAGASTPTVRLAAEAREDDATARMVYHQQRMVARQVPADAAVIACLQTDIDVDACEPEMDMPSESSRKGDDTARAEPGASLPILDQERIVYIGAIPGNGGQLNAPDHETNEQNSLAHAPESGASEVAGFASCSNANPNETYAPHEQAIARSIETRTRVPALAERVVRCPYLSDPIPIPSDRSYGMQIEDAFISKLGGICS